MKPITTLQRQKGLNLVELMIASTIGLLITLAVTSLFVSTRQSYSQNDNTAKMQENARFAMELISQDLRHASFMGNVASLSSVDVDAVAVTAPSNDCGPATTSGKAGLYNFSAAKLIINYGYQIDDASAYYNTCITGNVPTSPSNILLIKRTAGQTTPPTLTNPTVDQRQANHVYIFANGNDANLLTYVSGVTLPISNGEYWEYQPRIYYVANEDTNNNGFLNAGEDTNGNGLLEKDVLYRETLDYSTATPTMRAEPLAEGIQVFHVEFGIDTDHNGTPDYYYVPDANANPFDLTDTAMNEAISATLYILARTTEPDTTYTDTKTYTLGSMDPLGPFNDAFHRRVYAISVALKNRRPQVMNSASAN